MKWTKIALAVLMTCILLGNCDLDKQANSTAINSWHYSNPIDPNVPSLIEASAGPDGSAFRLKPSWEVSSIEYLDEWTDLAKPGLHDQLIKRNGATYKLGTSDVRPDDVQALVKAIDHLYPAQALTGSNVWPDSWVVELTGTDDQHVLLMASITGNPGDGPWNVLYNDRLYAQFDGSIARPLGPLFGGILSKDTDSPPESHLGSQVNFSTLGMPHQTIGFWGLLSISYDFTYNADADKEELKGWIKANPHDKVEVGQINNLESVQLSLDAGNQIPCKVEQLADDDPYTANNWRFSFSCHIKGVTQGQPYHYPIKIRLGIEQGDSIDVSGELYGTWPTMTHRNDILLMPPPPEIESALAAHPVASELLSDHLLGGTRYSATLTSNMPLKGKRRGDALLFGQTQMNGKLIRYIVDAQFAILDGKLIYWDLDRAALNQMLKTIIAYPLTKRVMEADPQTVIRMWYAKGEPSDEQTAMLDENGIRNFKMQVNPCGAVPGGAFPSEGKPLQAFSYESDEYFGDWPFVIINDQPVLSFIMFFPGKGELLQKALLPDALNTGSSRPFASIRLETKTDSSEPILHILMPPNITPGERAIYEERLKSLPVAAQPGDGQSEMLVRGVTLAVDSNGKLQIVSCSALPGRSNP